MASMLENLSTLFNERVFRIPDYQRGYSWRKNHLEAFWGDLNRIPDGRSHYMGQITLEPVPAEDWKQWDEDTWLISDAALKPFYVVDGQQRLTTAVIMIKCLLDVLETDETEFARTPKSQLIAKYLMRKSGAAKAYLFGYQQDNPSYEYLKTQILGEHSAKYKGTETLYTANLLLARDFFRNELGELKFPELEDVYKRLTQRLMINEYQIDDDLDVFVTFETMNNRGRPLSKLELLKNRLIYLSTLIPIKDHEKKALRRNINDAWRTIYEYLGKEKDRLLDDDEFLKAHWIMFFKYERGSANQYAKFLLEDYFTPKAVMNGELTDELLEAYVKSIQEASKAWYSIKFPTKSSSLQDPVRTALDRLQRLGYGAFQPLIMSAIAKKCKPAEVEKLLSRAERFIFLVSNLCRRRADTGDSEFFRLAGNLFRGKATLKDAIDTIDARSEEHFDWSAATTHARSLFANEGDGFYDWSGIQYFLYEYENALKEKYGAATCKINWHDLVKSRKDYATIEHIYPQTPKAGDWPDFDPLNEEQKRIYTHSLGNLVALARAKNSSLRNQKFEDKKCNKERTSGYFNGSYSEIEVNKNNEWKPQTIFERGLGMLDFIEKRWDVEFPDQKTKEEFLNLNSTGPM